MTHHPQLTLSVQLNDFATFLNFVPGQNGELHSHLAAMLAGRGESLFYLWGEPGSGRSHLLQACCHHAHDVGKTAVYLNLQDMKAFGPSICDGLEEVQIVCLDNIDAIAGDSVWEETLFHLYNRARSNGTSLVVTANVAPRHLTVKMPDLVSRLSWGIVYQVQELNDAEKVAALQLRAANRGFVLPDQVATFVVERCARNMRDLYDILEKLDAASLSAGRKLTLPFVKSVLGL